MRWIYLALYLLVCIAIFWWLSLARSFCCDRSSTPKDSHALVQPMDRDINQGRFDAESPYPISFRPSSAQPITGPSFERLRDSLVKQILQGQYVRIEGLAFPSDTAAPLGDSLALQRAREAQKLLGESLVDSLIQLSQRQAADTTLTNTELLPAVRFSLHGEKTPIVFDLNKATIRFPYNSTTVLQDPQVSKYLDELAEVLISMGARVQITGHTDNIGDPQTNIILGLWRAESVQTLLLQRGVAPSLVRIASSGEYEPIDTNTTPSGRSANRRVEIHIIQ